MTTPPTRTRSLQRKIGRVTADLSIRRSSWMVRLFWVLIGKHFTCTRKWYGIDLTESQTRLLECKACILSAKSETELFNRVASKFNQLFPKYTVAKIEKKCYAKQLFPLILTHDAPPRMLRIAQRALNHSSFSEWIASLSADDLQILLQAAYPHLPAHYRCPYSGKLLFLAFANAQGISYGFEFFRRVNPEGDETLTADYGTSWQLYQAFIETFENYRPLPEAQHTIKHVLHLLRAELPCAVNAMHNSFQSFMNSRWSLLNAAKSVPQQLLDGGWDAERCERERIHSEQQAQRLQKQAVIFWEVSLKKELVD